MYFIYSKGFGFIEYDGLIKGHDFTSYSYFFIVANETRKKTSYISLKNDYLGITLMLFVGVTFLIMLGTIILGVDTPLFAFKCGRWSLLYLIYFYVRTFSLSELKSLVKILFICTFVAGIAYYLQMFGIRLLTGRIDESEYTSDVTRYVNVPSLLSFFFVYCFLRNDISELKKLFLMFLGVECLLFPYGVVVF